MIVSQTTRELTDEERRGVRGSRRERFGQVLFGGALVWLLVAVFIGLPLGATIVYLGGSDVLVPISIFGMGTAVALLYLQDILRDRKRRVFPNNLSLIATTLEFVSALEVIEHRELDFGVDAVLVSSGDGWFAVLPRPTEKDEDRGVELGRWRRKTRSKPSLNGGWVLKPGHEPPRRVTVRSLSSEFNGEDTVVESITFSAEPLPVQGTVRHEDLPMTAFSTDPEGCNTGLQIHRQMREFATSPVWADLRASLKAESGGDDTMSL